MRTGGYGLALLLIGAASVLGACSTEIGPPALQGPPAMVDDAGTPRLWWLSKREEGRQVSVGSSRRTTSSTRTDTYFHFDLQAMDPVTARPLWSRRLLTLGDPDAEGYGPSRIVGSAASGQLLGQEGERVWLFLDDQLLAVAASDGHVLATFDTLEQRNPALKGLLPGETRYYSFDRGLVFMSADARSFVVRGPDFKADPYLPTAPQVAEIALKANGSPQIVPTPPLGEVPARLVQLPDGWLGLYTEKEASEAANDSFGDRLRYPYTILDEGAQARRLLWRMAVVETRRFDETYLRLDKPTPIADSPVFLRGRFLKDTATGQPRRLENPDGLAVWHVTRIDGEGRLALSRLGTDRKILWTAELPLSDNGTANPVRVWPLPDRLVVLGGEESILDGVSRREPHLLSLSLADGRWQGWNLSGETALP